MLEQCSPTTRIDLRVSAMQKGRKKNKGRRVVTDTPKTKTKGRAGDKPAHPNSSFLSGKRIYDNMNRLSRCLDLSLPFPAGGITEEPQHAGAEQQERRRFRNRWRRLTGGGETAQSYGDTAK